MEVDSKMMKMKLMKLKMKMMIKYDLKEALDWRKVPLLLFLLLLLLLLHHLFLLRRLLDRLRVGGSFEEAGCLVLATAQSETRRPLPLLLHDGGRSCRSWILSPATASSSFVWQSLCFAFFFFFLNFNLN